MLFLVWRNPDLNREYLNLQASSSAGIPALTFGGTRSPAPAAAVDHFEIVNKCNRISLLSFSEFIEKKPAKAKLCSAALHTW
jgi:hypothetical protein